MLMGIDPILSPDLLGILSAMGHGDEIVIADANFPADRCARRLVRLDGVDAVRTLRAVLSVMPLDHMGDHAAMSMRMVDTPDKRPEAVRLFQREIDGRAENPCRITPIERFSFYEHAKSAYAIVQTGEQRLYGNLLLVKGVIPPDPKFEAREV